MNVERVEAFDEMMNDSYESVTIGGIEFLPADILANCDPIAYNCYCGDFMAEQGEADDE